MKFQVITLGCKVNSYESEALKERLLKRGDIEVSKREEADIYFLNTCAVTSEAEKKDIQKVRSIARNHPQSKIVVMGCSSQIHKDMYLEIDNVVKVIGTSNKDKVECIKENRDLVDLDSRHFTYADTPITHANRDVRGYIKVQDGCDNFCSYCVVPFSRGNSRCRDHLSILKEARDLLDSSVKELVIGGIDTGCYKDPKDSDYNLTSLLEDMLHLSTSRYRIRVSSIECTQITDEYIKLFKDNKDVLCPHFHMPLQSGCDKTLKRMNRKYTKEEFYNKVKRIQEEIDDVAISVDVICGFPGESEEDFKETYSLCKDLGIMRIHAFPYSERPFTMASKLKDVIPIKVRMDRVKELIDLSDINDALFRDRLKDKKKTVLIEYKNKNARYEGYSENYLRYEIDSEVDIISQFVQI